MTRKRLVEVVRHLQQMAGPASGPTDGELLERYVHHADEGAFELLLWRHGSLVLNVCRRVLGNEQDAEDAFQATFLAFVRKASSIVRRGCVAGWLYRVAYRVALEARERAGRTARRERPGADLLVVEPSLDPLWSDLRPILDEELNHLPERLRRPLVLCYLEGKTNEEAARQLGCPAGTVYSRLARGRERLRVRLLRRGVALSGASLAMILCRDAAAGPAPVLVSATLRAALLFAAGRSVGGWASTEAAALAEGVLKTMSVSKVTIASVVILLAGVLAAGGALAQQALKEKPVPAAEKAGEKGADGKAIVQVVRPGKGGLVGWVRNTTVTLEPYEQQTIYAAVAGFVKEIRVDIGSRVKRGDVLAIIEVPDLVSDVEQAQAVLEQAKGQLLEAEAGVTIAEAEMRLAREFINQKQAEVEAARAEVNFAETYFKRIRVLVDKNAVGSEVLDEAKRKLEVAQAHLLTSRPAVDGARADLLVKEGRLVRAKAAVVTARGGINVAKAAVAKAHARLDLATVRAAFDGVVTARNIDPGSYVRAGETAERQALLKVVRVDLLRAVLQVPILYIANIHFGDQVALEFSGEPGVSLSGLKVSRISVMGSGNDGWRVEADVPNLKQRLLPGMAGTAVLHLPPSPDTLTIPTSCLIDGLTGTLLNRLPPKEGAVYVVRDGKAYREPVELGAEKGKRVEIFKGIKPTDQIVTNPKMLEGDGLPVEVKGEP